MTGLHVDPVDRVGSRRDLADRIGILDHGRMNEFLGTLGGELASASRKDQHLARQFVPQANVSEATAPAARRQRT